MKKGRLEAFTDGVVAIIITIMVLELKAPHSDNIKDMVPLLPVFSSYLLSFVYVGIYWNNHHHMLYLVNSITGSALWANLNLLFWLSLIPFTTTWMGENHFSKWPVVIYGGILLMCSLSYALLMLILARHCGKNSELATAVGKDWKGKTSTIIYIIAIGASLYNPVVGMALYSVVACIWFIPDRRIERKIVQQKA